ANRHRARAEDRAGPGGRDRPRALRRGGHRRRDAAGSGDPSRADAPRVRPRAARSDGQSHRPRGRRETPLTTAQGTAAQPLRVAIGEDVTVADLQALYHQIEFCTGAQTDRRMGIPGEDLSVSHPATEFVAWYNGHPDYRDCSFDLSPERVAVVGVGNVAVDVVRILCRTPEELATTDIADYALEALRKSRVKEVYLLGRRGPAQAAFTNPEVKELGELADADITAIPQEIELDPLSRAAVERSPDRAPV